MSTTQKLAPGWRAVAAVIGAIRDMVKLPLMVGGGILVGLGFVAIAVTQFLDDIGWLAPIALGVFIWLAFEQFVG